MPSYRIGFGSEFALKDRKIGVGTDNPTAELDIIGEINFDGVTGVGTFVRYSGFFPDEVTGDVTLTGEHQTSGDIVVGVGETFTVSVGATVNVGRVESINVSSHFSPPTGGVEDRPEVPIEGTVRFNKDLNTLEFYNGVDWRQFTVNGASGRAVFTGGTDASFSNFIDFVNIPTLGNAQDFGNTITSARFATACSSGTRGVFAIGYKSPGAYANEIEYITIAAGGNAIDFGDNTTSGYAQASLSSSTRGIWAGGQTPSGYTNVIDYVEIATIGNAVDFGDTTTPIDGSAGVASPTRGVIGGGRNPDSGSVGISVIQSITIASKGNAVDDGDLTHRRKDLGGMSNSTRGIFSGGRDGAAGIQFSDIDFITIATTGNAQDFGNLTFTGAYLASASNQTRGVTAGGSTTGVKWNIINYITIATTGNAQDFGDLTLGRYALGGLSDSHGGLGGY